MAVFLGIGPYLLCVQRVPHCCSSSAARYLPKGKGSIRLTVLESEAGGASISVDLVQTESGCFSPWAGWTGGWIILAEAKRAARDRLMRTDSGSWENPLQGLHCRWPRSYLWKWCALSTCAEDPLSSTWTLEGALIHTSNMQWVTSAVPLDLPLHPPMLLLVGPTWLSMKGKGGVLGAGLIDVGRGTGKGNKGDFVFLKTDPAFLFFFAKPNCNSDFVLELWLLDRESYLPCQWIGNIWVFQTALSGELVTLKSVAFGVFFCIVYFLHSRSFRESLLGYSLWKGGASLSTLSGAPFPVGYQPKGTSLSQGTLLLGCVQFHRFVRPFLRWSHVAQPCLGPAV